MTLRAFVLLLAVMLAMGLAGCSEEGSQVDEPDNPALRRELLQMRDADQAERTGRATWTEASDRARTERLREIIDEYGWPTPDMVGKDGASAAWLIAQHSDLDVAFQERVLALMREAAARGDADPTEVAYLTDRVAINKGRRQTYGTQISCRGDRAVTKPMVDPAGVDERRREVGLQPLEKYLAEVGKHCAADL